MIKNLSRFIWNVWFVVVFCLERLVFQSLEVWSVDPVEEGWRHTEHHEA